MMTKLSVNINKIATLRNARGGNVPDVIASAKKIQEYGAQGITVHPRPDERHITYQDVYDLKNVVYTELNIEGNPSQKFMDLVLKIVPDQVTLVPDADDAITSTAGWDTMKYEAYLSDIISTLKQKNIRVSIFLDPRPELVQTAAKTGTDRIELYTELYAKNYASKQPDIINTYIETAALAKEFDLNVNAGHDLDLTNLSFLIEKIPFLSEVSIGHALITDALTMGLENSIHAYLKRIEDGTRKANTA